eukprot:CAMPEP_0194213018 /NCGR_PEP_ID=MMETSP0156-20130528/13300_1 /TAXON_ID=33649 /ORGANISM="Thalassionema nitzschioides, Strain L26-B" /LENGTH=543 /DNA_ID=CAMNT_0038940959 /DNA_START=160 /DNA_END=1791 /DNA_ORIENTATION=-
MMNRIRGNSNAQAEDQSIHGVGSLISGHPDGISLDGESLVLPSEFDDMSFNTFNDSRAPDQNIRIVGPGDDSTIGIPAIMKGSENEKRKDEQQMEPGGGLCAPSWLLDAPSWLKIAIVLSTALLVGAVVLLTVAAALNSSADKDAKSSSATDSGNFVFTPGTRTPLDLKPTSAPSDGPSTQPSLHSTSSPTITHRPTFQGETYPPSSFPTTFFPSILPSVSPTDIPSYTPSEYPSHLPSTRPSSFPSIVRSYLPTVFPSVSPTNIASEVPSISPSETPPITGSKTVFYLTAGRPLDQMLEAFEDSLGDLPTNSDFMVHLGDFNRPLVTNCVEESYEVADSLYSRSSVPVYFLPGDNEYNDCPNPSEAFGFWKQYMLGYESKYWPPPRWELERDEPPYEPNFAFVLRGVLYVGVNLVGGNIHDQDEWDARQKANIEWISSQFTTHRAKFEILILMTHADPDTPDTNDGFFEPLFEMVKSDFNVPTVLIHRNWGTDSAGLQEAYQDIDDFVVLVVKGDTWPPMMVTIDIQTGSFSWDQGRWLDKN